jgi:predicted nucleic acid-binding protein
LDASVAVSFVLPDEASQAAQDVLSRVIAEGAVTPGAWHIEVGNALLVQVRRGRLLPEDIEAGFARLAALKVETDSGSPTYYWSDAMALALRHGLTLYDAVYLELALRRGLPLASFDKALRRAAAAEGVTLANPPA